MGCRGGAGWALGEGCRPLDQMFYTEGGAGRREGRFTCYEQRGRKNAIFWSFHLLKVINKETNKLYFYLLEFYQCLNINN